MKLVFWVVALLNACETSADISCVGSMCNVLVVVDLQNDYCKGCGSPSVSPWAATETKDLVPIIAKAITLKRNDGTSFWDLLVFTKDALEQNQVCQDVNGNGKSDDAQQIDGKRICDGNSSLIFDTVGWHNPQQVIDARNQADAAQVIHTKSTDDWMTTLNPDTSYDGKYKYDVHLEESEVHHTLKEKISSHLPSEPGKTNLVVTGIETNRCVMKGSVHATVEGYKVIVLTDAIYGPDEADRWVTEGEDANAPGLDCSSETFTDKCKEEVYLGYKGGPTSAMAIKYMEKSGCEFSTLDEIKEFLGDNTSAFMQVSAASLFTGLTTPGRALILFLPMLFLM